ncbi:hypothetical protein D3C72_1029000 [compost metagenome]
MARQVQVHPGALADLAVQGDMAVGLLAEAVHHRQAQADALADRLGAEERLEGMLQRALRHALAVIDNSQAYIVAGAQGTAGELPGADVLVTCLDAQLAAAGHGFAGIEQHVVEGFLQLLVIGFDRPQALGDLQVQVHGRAQASLQALGLEQVVQVDLLAVQRLPGRESQQAVGQAGGA